MNNKVSQMRWFQTHRNEGTGAGTSTYYTRTLCMPLATPISSWLKRKVNFGIRVCKPQTELRSQMNNKVSQMRWFQTHRNEGTGAGTSTYYTRTLCMPLATPISSWLKRKVNFGIRVHKLNSSNFARKQSSKILCGL
jgi:hypothetical protein